MMLQGMPYDKLANIEMGKWMSKASGDMMCGYAMMLTQIAHLSTIKQ